MGQAIGELEEASLLALAGVESRLDEFDQDAVGAAAAVLGE
jgi:hypothetical protein